MNRRNLLILLAVGLGLILAGQAMWGWYSERHGSLEEEIELKRLQYEKLSRMVASSGRLETRQSRLQDLAKRVRDEQLITGATSSLAEANFQNLVQSLADQTGLSIRSMKILPATKQEGMPLLNLMVNARGEIGAIRDFVVAVESSPRFVFFSEVDIKQLSAYEQRWFTLNAKLAAVTE